MCLTCAHQVSFSELLRNTRARVRAHWRERPHRRWKPFCRRPPSPDNCNGRNAHRSWSGSRVAFFDVTVCGAQELGLGNTNRAKDAFRELRIDPSFASLEVPNACRIPLTSERLRFV